MRMLDIGLSSECYCWTEDDLRRVYDVQICMIQV